MGICVTRRRAHHTTHATDNAATHRPALFLRGHSGGRLWRGLGCGRRRLHFRRRNSLRLLWCTVLTSKVPYRANRDSDNKKPFNHEIFPSKIEGLARFWASPARMQGWAFSAKLFSGCLNPIAI